MQTHGLYMSTNQIVSNFLFYILFALFMALISLRFLHLVNGHAYSLPIQWTKNALYLFSQKNKISSPNQTNPNQTLLPTYNKYPLVYKILSPLPCSPLPIWSPHPIPHIPSLLYSTICIKYNRGSIISNIN